MSCCSLQQRVLSLCKPALCFSPQCKKEVKIILKRHLKCSTGGGEASATQGLPRVGPCKRVWERQAVTEGRVGQELHLNFFLKRFFYRIQQEIKK